MPSLDLLIFFSFGLLVWWITLVDFKVLKPLHILGENTIWSWYNGLVKKSVHFFSVRWLQLSLTPFETILFFKKQFYYFKKGKNVTETQNRVVQYMEKVLRLIQLYTEDFSLDGAPWFSRPVDVDSDQTETLTENDQRYTMWEVANILKISKSNIENHLHQLACVKYFDVWVPHKLSGEKKKSFLTLFSHVIL